MTFDVTFFLILNPVFLLSTTSTIPVSRHSIVVNIRVQETCHGHALAGPLPPPIKASLVMVPGPVRAVPPLPAQLAAGFPAGHLLVNLFILTTLGVHFLIGTLHHGLAGILAVSAITHELFILKNIHLFIPSYREKTHTGV